ncbi:hypothetical protein ACKKBG_A28020 [Auxenochlorella protothecoides x Auxenochlorella symbiontica]
MDLDGP